MSPAELRQIALASDEISLVHAMRARADALNVSRSEIDRVAELTPGAASKLLALPPIRNFGPLNAAPMFWAMLACLGLVVALVEDPQAMAHITAKMDPRDTKNVRRRMMIAASRIPWLITAKNARELGVKGGKARLTKLSVSSRRKIAKLAGIASGKARRRAVRARDSSAKA